MGTSLKRVPWSYSIVYEACSLAAVLPPAPSDGTSGAVSGTDFQNQLVAQEVACLLDSLLQSFRHLHHVDSYFQYLRSLNYPLRWGCRSIGDFFRPRPYATIAGTAAASVRLL